MKKSTIESIEMSVNDSQNVYVCITRKSSVGEYVFNSYVRYTFNTDKEIRRRFMNRVFMAQQALFERVNGRDIARIEDAPEKIPF